jgi:ATP-dependent exoDNAse (exonuclease V) beta subunit
VLGAVNAIGEGLLDDFKALVAGVDTGAEIPGGSPAVELLLTDGGTAWEEAGLRIAPGSGSPQSRHAEALFLARRLRELVEAGVDRAEIVVLLRAMNHARAYELALERFGLAPYVVGGRGYWSHQQVEDARQLLGVVANPLDDVSLFGSLSSPACGASADALWLLRRAAGEGTPIWPSLSARFGSEPPEETGDDNGAARYASLIPDRDAELLRRFVARIARLRAAASRLGLEELVESTISEFDYDLATLRRPNGRARMANLRKLMRLAREFEQHEGPELRAFLDYVDSRGGRDDRESEAATEAERHDGVRVMTVHNAKGLQFPVVAVADLGRTLRVGGAAGVRLDVKDDDAEALRIGLRLARLGGEPEELYAYKDLELEARHEDEAEELRLGYVAASRAQRRLILSGCFTPGKAPADKPSPTTPIAARLIAELGVAGREDETVTVPAPKALQGVEPRLEPVRIPVRVNLPSPAAAEALNAQATEEEPEAERALDQLELRGSAAVPRPAPPRLSYSALADFERCPYKFYVERVLGLGRPPTSAPVEDGDVPVARELRYGLGSAVHALLEWSARNLWRPPDEARVRAALAAAGLEPEAEQLARATAMVGRWLDSELCEELRAGDGAVRAEVPFLLPLDGSILRGSIDLLAGPRDGAALVLDYKTDSLADRDPDRLMDGYERQRDLYALAAASAGAERVRTAYFFCDEPGILVESEYGAAELIAARARLAELVDEVSEGRFKPTDRPHRRLCTGCPAQERLCSHGKEMTMRDSPEG